MDFMWTFIVFWTLFSAAIWAYRWAVKTDDLWDNHENKPYNWEEEQ